MDALGRFVKHEAHHSKVDKIEPLLPLMTEGKNECEIDAPSGSLKSQREEQTVIDRKRYGMVYDYYFYLFDGIIFSPGIICGRGSFVGPGIMTICGPVQISLNAGS